MRVKLSWAFEGDTARSTEVVEADSTTGALLAKTETFDRIPVYLSAEKEQPCDQP